MTYNFKGVEFDVTYEYLRVNGVEITQLRLMMAIAKLLSVPDDHVSAAGDRYAAYYDAIDAFLSDTLIPRSHE